MSRFSFFFALLFVFYPTCEPTHPTITRNINTQRFTEQRKVVAISKAHVWWCCRLQAQQKEWLALQAELLAQGSVLRGELSASQLERTRLEGELSALRETNQNMDISSARLTSQYQVLTRCTHAHTHTNVPTQGCTQVFCIHAASQPLTCKKGI